MTSPQIFSNIKSGPSKPYDMQVSFLIYSHNRTLFVQQHAANVFHPAIHIILCYINSENFSFRVLILVKWFEFIGEQNK